LGGRRGTKWAPSPAEVLIAPNEMNGIRKSSGRSVELGKKKKKESLRRNLPREEGSRGGKFRKGINLSVEGRWGGDQALERGVIKRVGGWDACDL